MHTHYSNSLPITQVASHNRLRMVDWLFILAVVACVLEGAIRKWAFPSEGMVKYALYFSKDILLFLCLFCLRPPKRSIPDFMNSILSIGIIFTVIGCVIGSIGGFNLIGAILTVRSAIILPILSFILIPQLSSKTLFTLGKVIFVLAVVNALLGFVQYFSPSSSFINKYTSDDYSRVATTGFSARVRATGTFSYITGYGCFAIFAVSYGITMVSYAAIQRIFLPLGLCTIASAVICAGASVSRAVVLGVLCTLIAWILFSKDVIKSLGLFLIGTTFLYVCLAFLGFSDQTSEILGAAHERHSKVNDSAVSRLFTPYNQAMEALSLAPFGMGLGTEQVGGNYYASGMMKFTTLEHDWGRIILEMGFLGFIGNMIIYVGAMYALYSLWSRNGNRSDRKSLVAITAGCFFLFFGGVIFNHISSFLFWTLFTLGAVIGIDNLPTDRPKTYFTNTPNQ